MKNLSNERYPSICATPLLQDQAMANWGLNYYVQLFGPHHHKLCCFEDTNVIFLVDTLGVEGPFKYLVVTQINNFENLVEKVSIQLLSWYLSRPVMTTPPSHK
jgi:hypothetical protein